MKLVYRIFFLSVCAFSSINLYSQTSLLRLGVRLGAGLSVTPGVDKILVSEDFYSNYSFKDKFQVVPDLGVFVQYHAPQSVLAVEGGINYWQNASRLVYADKENLHYTLDSRYNFIGLSAFFKVFPWRTGFNIAVGGRVGANLNNKGLSYASNQEDEQFSAFHFATVAETERLMREKLTGNPNVSIGGGFGYEIGKQWAIDLRYFYGVNSSLSTETNTFDWFEHPTHSHEIVLSLSYFFDL